jgi:KDO2-lipid IV(A) lauroyltransferase
MPEADRPAPLASFWQPRYWPIWLGLGLLRLVALLPYKWQCRIGRGLGRLVGRVLPDRRRVAATNLALCFPELGEPERAALLRRTFDSLGLQLVEFGLSWWASDAELRGLIRLTGVENLERAMADGRGTIFLSGHFASIEFGGRALLPAGVKLAGLYRPNKNAFVDELMRRARLRSCVDLIPKDSMRQMVRRLSQGVSVWYAPDQSYRRRYSVLIPFFGEPAMTNGALTHIARIGNARVVPFFSRRLPDDAGYEVSLEPALEDFPSGDMEADARRVNAWLEAHIRLAPEQYYWIHRRFKGRPEGFSDPYPR